MRSLPSTHKPKIWYPKKYPKQDDFFLKCSALKSWIFYVHIFGVDQKNKKNGKRKNTFACVKKVLFSQQYTI